MNQLIRKWLLKNNIYLKHKSFLRETIWYNIVNPYKECNDKTQSIFIHIPKNAGMSISKTIYGENRGHSRLLHYQKYDEEKFQQYFKYTFVRNPWDRFVSAYLFLLKGGRHEIDKKWADYYLTKFDDINKFIIRLGNDSGFRCKILSAQHFVPQVEYIKDKEDKINLDFIGKFENLNEDFRKIKEKLNVKDTLEEININKNKGNYLKYYTTETYEIIKNIYTEDVNRLGY